jgi:MFS superfamily sulfate permease-like transporter
VPGVVIVRLDAPMYYANALTARDGVKTMLREATPPVRAVVFDAEGQDDLDLTSADVLKRLVAELRDGGMAVYFADVHAPVLERARETGLLEVVGNGHVFPTVDLAVREIEGHAAQPPGEDPDVRKHE